MKNLYTLLILAILSFTSHAQNNYELGLVHITDYNFKVVAIPDFDSTGNTDISDISFTLALPAGSTDVVNAISSLSGRTWTINASFDAALLTSASLGDGTRDVFQIFIPTGQSLIPHTNGEQIDLVSFNVNNSPTNGMIEFLPNNDPIVLGAGGILDNYYNSNIDNTTTQDYFTSIANGMENFSFSTLSTNNIAIQETQISVYPNPAKNVLNIATKGKSISYELFNILGQTVKINGSIGNNEIKTINISNLPNGIYLLKTEDDNNNKKSFKILKNK